MHISKEWVKLQNVTQMANMKKQAHEVECALDYCLVGLVSASFGMYFLYFL